MPDNVQPLYQGGDPSLPLSPSPFYSRKESKDLSAASPENYSMLGFRPGFSLQASELNEIQENFQMQMTLTTTMMHNWITSGAGTLWSGYNQNSIGSEGNVDDSNSGNFVDSISTGSEDGNFVISSPGWRGSCPLHPYHSPYQGQGNDRSVEVSVSGGTVTATFNPGWWLVEVRDYWSGSQQQPKDISGLKHWIYLDSAMEVSETFLDGSNEIIVFGFNINSEYSTCEQDDGDLADNSSGVANAASCGADRYKLSVVGINTAKRPANGNWDASGIQDRDSMSLICYFDANSGSMRYMNNMIIPQS